MDSCESSWNEDVKIGIGCVSSSNTSLVESVPCRLRHRGPELSKVSKYSKYQVRIFLVNLHEKHSQSVILSENVSIFHVRSIVHDVQASKVG